MSSALSRANIRSEWNQLQRRSKHDPGVVFLGYQTGQLAHHSNDPETDVDRVYLKAYTVPSISDRPNLFYHPVVHWTTEDGERVQKREQFRHPMPAQDWLLESVPDFDLLETVSLNVPEEDQETPRD